MKLYDVIIIGGGPAGYSAALYAARNARSVLVIEKLSAGGQMGTDRYFRSRRRSHHQTLLDNLVPCCLIIRHDDAINSRMP